MQQNIDTFAIWVNQGVPSGGGGSWSERKLSWFPSAGNTGIPSKAA